MKEPAPHAAHPPQHHTQKRRLPWIKRGAIIALFVFLSTVGFAVWAFHHKTPSQQHSTVHKTIPLNYQPIHWEGAGCSGFCMQSPMGLIPGGHPVSFTWSATTQPIVCYLLAYYRADQHQIPFVVVPKDKTSWTIAPLPPGDYAWQLIADSSLKDCAQAKVIDHPTHVWVASGGSADADLGSHSQAWFTVTAPSCAASGGKCIDAVKCEKQCGNPATCSCISSYPDCPASKQCLFQY